MKLIAYLMLFLLPALPCKSQPVLKPKAKLLTRFPFKLLTGGIVIIKAKVDACPDSLNFVLDTGSGGISLDSATVERLGIPSSKTDTTIRGIGGSRNVNFAFNHQLKLPGLAVSNLNFHINNYELLTSSYGVRIDGIIGYSVLRRYIVYLNYDSNYVSFYTPGYFRYPSGGYMLKPSFSTLPLQTAQVEDQRKVIARFLLDTGAGLCMLFSEKFVEDSSLLKPNKKMFNSYGEGIGGKKAMRYMVIRDVKLGPYKFRKVPVFVFNDDNNLTSYPFMKGIIGNDILRRFNVVINYADQCIHIKPNTRYFDDFDYAYTGLELYLINEKVTVDEVMEGSPADIAGFKAGDKIIAINTTFTDDIQVYKQLLQDPGVRHKLIIVREGQLVELHIRVKDIR